MTSGTTPLLWLGVTTAMGLLAAVIFLSAPSMDIKTAALFAAPDGSGFPLSRHPLALWFNRLIVTISQTGGAFLVLGLCVTAMWRRPLFGLSQQHFWFFILSALTAPVLVVNLILKSFWGRARPDQIVEFGGNQDFSPAFFISDQCSTNCSFVSGDVAAAFSLLALAVVIRRRRAFWVSLVVVFGTVIAMTRMAQGAHFLSDTIYGGIFTAAIILLLKHLVLDSKRALGKGFEQAMNSLVDGLAIVLTAVYILCRGRPVSGTSIENARLDVRLRLWTDGWLRRVGISDLDPKAVAANKVFWQAPWTDKLKTYLRAGPDRLGVVLTERHGGVDTKGQADDKTRFEDRR